MYHMGYGVKNIEWHIVKPKKDKKKPTLNASCISIYSTNLRIEGIRFYHIEEEKNRFNKDCKKKLYLFFVFLSC